MTSRTDDGDTDAGADERKVPFRRYFAFWGIGVLVVGGTFLAFNLASRIATVLALVIVAAFFAIALSPAVHWVERRLHFRRSVATMTVFVIGLFAFAGLVYAFARPIYDASNTFTDDLPRIIRNAEHGKGQVGHWLKDIGAQQFARENLPKFRRELTNSNGLVSAAGTIVTGTIATLTILVLIFLMLLQGPRIGEFLIELFPYQRANHLRRVASDAARAVTGYMAGNLLISLIAGTAIYIWLRSLFIPFAFVLALWVAFADMIPLVGAILGAIPTIFVALIDSPGAGIATIIFFVVYQLFENHVLQTTIMAKAVHLNPLGVLLSVLVGVELAGLLGALLAIPIAGALQVIARDVWVNRREVVEEVLSIGTDAADHLEELADDVDRREHSHIQEPIESGSDTAPTPNGPVADVEPDGRGAGRAARP
ncbi:MAG: AI-2E family transporter [Acidimicrobiia bacterium]